MSDGNPVLYMGDTGIDAAAAYLAAVMTHYRIGFDYVPPTELPGDRIAGGNHRLIILSDYPSSLLSDMDALTARVRDGAGLVMIGGWESFHGAGGSYDGTPVEDMLPVRIHGSDDRMNYSYPCLAVKVSEHDILADLPFERPPVVGGYNRVAASDDAQVLLHAVRYETSARGAECELREAGRDVLLAVGQFGAGRTAAFTSDAAPHWVGGFVDWGEKRVGCLVAEREVEVGENYARFFRNLIAWAGRL